MKQPLPPFSSTYSPNIPELIHQLGCTIVISTYQAGKVIFLSAPSSDKLVQLPRTFPRAMGIGVKDQRMAIATDEEVVVLGHDGPLATHYPNKPQTYDTLYVPRSTYYTGKVDLHDVEWGDEGLWGVNTMFSCLALIDDKYSFTPKWKPPFISDLKPEDRCHLNGVAMKNGKPKYVSALGQTNTKEGWRANKLGGGLIMDVESNEVVVSGLSMPHSPRLYDDELYVLLSASGELIKVDKKRGTYEVINQMNGFVRGMDRIGDYLFVGLSKIRTTSSAFRDLPIAKKSVFCGLVVIYLPMGNVVGHIKYESSVEELYDVKILPELRRPGILSPNQDVHKRALVLPNTSFWGMEGKK